ncbi:MAG: nicotinate-nucleotide adenylyltransferase [Xanthomonadales bacterium]|nr:nicotinate-nucleotide adenylyltransferase [Xanthomonadales bacterium]
MNQNNLDEPLALFGGTFDPVHYGNLRCAEEARQKLGLDQLFLLPAGNPAHRATPQATPEQRLDMLQLAQLEFPALSIDDRELRRSGPSYMVDTLREIREEFPQRSLLLLIGQDAANRLHKWHEWEQLFSLTNLVILTRPGESEDYRHDLANKIQNRLLTEVEELKNSQADGVLQLRVSPVEISATTIQSMMRLGRSPKSMMPDSILNYIDENRLYSPD